MPPFPQLKKKIRILCTARTTHDNSWLDAIYRYINVLAHNGTAHIVLHWHRMRAHACACLCVLVRERVHERERVHARVRVYAQLPPTIGRMPVGMAKIFIGDICGRYSGTIFVEDRKGRYINGRYLWTIFVEEVLGRYSWKISMDCICGRCIWMMCMEDISPLRTTRTHNCRSRSAACHFVWSFSPVCTRQFACSVYRLCVCGSGHEPLRPIIVACTRGKFIADV